MEKTPEVFGLKALNVESGTDTKPRATVKMKVRGKSRQKTAGGDGPVDATYRAIAALTKTKSALVQFDVKGITGGTDALGEVTVSLEEKDRTARGHGADTDIIVAAAKAYINAINKLEARKK
jgi:2-isopropylmalate synthase